MQYTQKKKLQQVLTDLNVEGVFPFDLEGQPTQKSLVGTALTLLVYWRSDTQNYDFFKHLFCCFFHHPLFSPSFPVPSYIQFPTFCCHVAYVSLPSPASLTVLVLFLCFPVHFHNLCRLSLVHAIYIHLNINSYDPHVAYTTSIILTLTVHKSGQESLVLLDNFPWI